MVLHVWILCVMLGECLRASPLPGHHELTGTTKVLPECLQVSRSLLHHETSNFYQVITRACAKEIRHCQAQFGQFMPEAVRQSLLMWQPSWLAAVPCINLRASARECSIQCRRALLPAHRVPRE